MRAAFALTCLLPAFVLLGGCSSEAASVSTSAPPTASAGPANTGSPSPGPRASSSPSPSTPTPAPTLLPGGLEPRPELPPLAKGEAAACVPECGAGRAAGGKLPVGRYQTRWFFGGYMTLESEGTWPRDEDSNGELSMLLGSRHGNPIEDHRIAFWLDPVLVLHGAIASDVPLQAEAYVEWLKTHPELVVSESETTKIGVTPAIAVDVSLASNAGQDAPDCAPDPCVEFFGNLRFGHLDGILGDDVYRLYFANVHYSGTDHLFFVKVEGSDRSNLTSVLPSVEEVLDTVTIPARSR